MTTQKQTEAEADASQNRETALVNGVKYVIAGKLNEASVIQRPNGSKLYLALPVNDGKDGIYGANRWRIVRPLTFGEPFIDKPA